MKPNLSNKDCVMQIAKKFQKRMLLPKIFFWSFGVVGSIATVQEVFSGTNIFKQYDAFVTIFLIYLFSGAAFVIFYTLFAGICPYCHNFQKLNGRSYNIDGENLSHSKGISPFIHYCNQCGAPLSPKAVEHYYRKREQVTKKDNK